MLTLENNEDKDAPAWIQHKNYDARLFRLFADNLVKCSDSELALKRAKKAMTFFEMNK